MIENIFNLSEWMHPEHCTPCFWFRALVVTTGSYVALVYAVFSFWVLVKLRQPLARLIEEDFYYYLGVVFALCLAVHFAHSYSYIHQYFKLLLVFTYPLLCYYHTMLLLSSKKAIETFKKLKTPEDIANLKAKYEKSVEKELMLEGLIAEAAATKNVDKLKEYVLNSKK